jgi:hypothetical protein
MRWARWMPPIRGAQGALTSALEAALTVLQA